MFEDLQELDSAINDFRKNKKATLDDSLQQLRDELMALDDISIPASATKKNQQITKSSTKTVILANPSVSDSFSLDIMSAAPDVSELIMLGNNTVQHQFNDIIERIVRSSLYREENQFTTTDAFNRKFRLNFSNMKISSIFDKLNHSSDKPIGSYYESISAEVDSTIESLFHSDLSQDLYYLASIGMDLKDPDLFFTTNMEHKTLEPNTTNLKTILHTIISHVDTIKNTRFEHLSYEQANAHILESCEHTEKLIETRLGLYIEEQQSLARRLRAPQAGDNKKHIQKKYDEISEMIKSDYHYLSTIHTAQAKIDSFTRLLSLIQNEKQLALTHELTTKSANPTLMIEEALQQLEQQGHSQHNTNFIYCDTTLENYVSYSTSYVDNDTLAQAICDEVESEAQAKDFAAQIATRANQTSLANESIQQIQQSSQIITDAHSSLFRAKLYDLLISYTPRPLIVSAIISQGRQFIDKLLQKLKHSHADTYQKSPGNIQFVHALNQNCEYNHEEIQKHYASEFKQATNIDRSHPPLSNQQQEEYIMPTYSEIDVVKNLTNEIDEIKTLVNTQQHMDDAFIKAMQQRLKEVRGQLLTHALTNANHNTIMKPLNTLESHISDTSLIQSVNTRIASAHKFLEAGNEAVADMIIGTLDDTIRTHAASDSAKQMARENIRDFEQRRNQPEDEKIMIMRRTAELEHTARMTVGA